MDFKTVLLTDSRINDIKSEITYGVESGAQSTNCQQFAANSISNSSVTYNIQVPNKQVVIDRNLKIQNTLSFTVNIANVPAGSQAFSYGFSDSVQAFPFMKAVSTVQCNINNCNISTNLQDIIDVVLKQNDIRELNRYNSSCPSYPDSQVGQYTYTSGANAFSIAGSSVNPMGSISGGSLDYDFAPRGAFPLTFCQVDRYVAGAYTDHSPVSTGANNTWKVSIQLTTQEPIGLALSPWISTNPFDSAGMYGINNVTFTFNIDATLQRIFSSSNYTVAGGVKTAWITGISPGITPQGGTAQLNFISNSQMLFNMLSLQPSQLERLSSIQSIPYIDYSAVQITPSSQFNSLAAGQSVQLNSGNYQFSLIADKYIVFVRQQLTLQGPTDPASFLTINSVELSFNNKSGICSSFSQNDLWQTSIRNGSQQSWLEFSGQVAQNNNATGCAYTVPGLGSILVLNPAELFGLPDDLAPGAVGQYNFSAKINVTNQYSYAVSPEIVILPIQSGVIQIKDGTTQAYVGLLTASRVLDSKSSGESESLDKTAYDRLVGGKSLHQKALSGLHKIVGHIKPHLKHIQHKLHGSAVSGGAISAAGVHKVHHRRVSKYM